MTAGHFFLFRGPGAMSACGHVHLPADAVPEAGTEPIMTTCGGCLRSRHFKAAVLAVMETEQW